MEHSAPCRISMHIKELIIDGFKSYANRTVISGWDQGKWFAMIWSGVGDH
jgi:hypothetical protein